MIHGPVELIQQSVGTTMNNVRVEIERGYIYIDNCVSNYVEFCREGDEYIVSEVHGRLSTKQLGLVLFYLNQMEDELNVRN